MPSTALSIPFLLFLGIYGYLVYHEMVPEAYYWCFILGLLPLFGIYVTRREIHLWYYKRYPPKIPGPILKIIERNYSFYRNLSLADKAKFRLRLALSMLEKVYETEIEPLGEDMKAFLAVPGTILFFGTEKIEFPEYERVAFLPSVFLSPKIKEFHACEVNHEEKTVMIANDRLMKAAFYPEVTYNIAFYIQALMYKELYQLDTSIFADYSGEAFEDKLLLIRGFGIDEVRKATGLAEPCLYALLSEYFIMRPEKFKRYLPELYDWYCQAFGLKPS